MRKGNKMKKMIYHATSYDNLQSIMQYGLKPSAFGETYFANKADYAAGFAKLYSGSTEFKIVVLPVDASLLDESKLSVGVDHAPMFFPDDLEVTVYAGLIPSQLIDLDEALVFDSSTS